MSHKQLVGKFGEDVAAKYLEHKGYKILEKNFRIRGGEIDLVAKYGQSTVFVEVKTRTSQLFGLPEEAITPSKVAFLERAIAFYCLVRRISDENIRLDAVLIEADAANVIRRIDHFENVSE